eukprot:3991129-Ditylum_brightwellii.AAC.1
MGDQLPGIYKKKYTMCGQLKICENTSQQTLSGNLKQQVSWTGSRAGEYTWTQHATNNGS